MATLHYNITGSRRKELVEAIAKHLNAEAKYLRVPTCAYQIAEYNVSKDGALSWEDMDDAEPGHIDRTNDLVNAMAAAGFGEPEEWAFFRQQEKAMEALDGTGTPEPEEVPTELEEAATGEDTGLTVEMPRDYFTEDALENLKKLVAAKAPLLKQALAAERLPILITDEKVSFPWFKEEIDADTCAAYTHLITAICQMAKEAKRVTAKEKEVENSKYAFRCFLLRLGFIGDSPELKKTRKILLSRLSGSGAFKSGHKRETAPGLAVIPTSENTVTFNMEEARERLQDPKVQEEIKAILNGGDKDVD